MQNFNNEKKLYGGKMKVEPTAEPFNIKDCALLVIATGKSAQNLRELRDNLITIDPGSIYYHFWGTLLRPRFDDPEYNNDFAAWVRHNLHDGILAERLGVVDPSEFNEIDDLRHELIDLIEERLDESEVVLWTKADQQFYFLRSQIVVFDTRKSIYTPEELVNIIPQLSIGSIFYHFIDAKRRTPEKRDDFRAWLSGFGETYADIIEELGAIDPFFSSLTQLRRMLSLIFQNMLGDRS